MKKTLTIAFAIITISLSAQYQTPTRLWKGFSVQGSDTLLVDSITGLPDSDAKVWKYRGTIDSTYFQCNRGGYLILLGDTLAISTINEYKANYNKADSLFFKLERQILNSDSTERYPKKVSRIAFYETPTKDDNNYFGALYPQSPLEVGTNKTYSTIAGAISAANDGDTIVVFDYTSPQVTSNTGEEYTFISVGNSDFTASTYGFLLYYKATIIGFEIPNSTYAIRLTGSGNNSIHVKDCHVKGNTTSLYSIVPANDTLFVEDTYILGNINYQGKCFKGNRNYYAPAAQHIIPRSDIYEYYTYHDTNSYASYFVQSNINIKIHVFGSTIIGGGLRASSTIDTLDVLFKKCYFSPLELNSDFRYSLGTHSGNNTWDSCVFYRDHVSGSYVIDVYNTGNLTIKNCSFENMYGSFLRYTGYDDFTAIINNNSFIANGLSYLGVTDMNVQLTNTSLYNTPFYFTNSDTVRDCLIDSLTFGNDLNVGYSAAQDFNLVIRNSSFIMDDTASFSLGTSDLVNIGGFVFQNNYVEYNAQNVTNTLFSVSSLIPKYRYQQGIIVEKNKIRMPRLVGNENGVHTWLSYRNKCILRYNWLEGATIGYVNKNPEDTIDCSSEVYGNLFIDCYTPIYFRALPYAKVYQNTFVNENYSLNNAVWIDDNGDVLPEYPNPSDSGQFYNNIVYSIQGGSAFWLADSSLNGWQFDNNLYYGVDFETDTGGVVNYATWQGYGYDTLKSININPLFTDVGNGNYSLKRNSPAIDRGKNLGTTYKYGLNNTTVWPNSIVLSEQNDLWDIGAYISIKKPYQINYKGERMRFNYKGNNIIKY